jgi:LacI family transcriptional regulator
MATMREVAEAAGVSTATVSRVLNRTGPVSVEVRERVERVIAELGYSPNALARSLRTESTGTIGLIVSSILNPFFTELARVAEDVASAHGFNVIIGNADEDPAKEERYLRTLLEKRVDGLLLNPASADAPYIREVAGRGVPIVLIDRTVPGVEAPLVRADGRAAITELVAHLHGLGRRRLGMVSGPPALRNARERLAAFTEAAAAAGAPVDPAHIGYGDFERASGARAMTALLAAEPRPDAVFVANGRMTLGALEALRMAGVRIGVDLALASYDDDPWFSLLDPPLTAIGQPTADLARVAMTTLLRRIRGEPPEPPPALTARLVIRASCGEAPAQIPNPIVSEVHP